MKKKLLGDRAFNFFFFFFGGGGLASKETVVLRRGGLKTKVWFINKVDN